MQKLGCKIEQNYRFSLPKIYFKPFYSAVSLFSSSLLSNKPMESTTFLKRLYPIAVFTRQIIPFFSQIWRISLF